MSGSYTLPERIAKSPRWTSHSDKDPFKLVYSVAHKFRSGVTVVKAAVITCAALPPRPIGGEPRARCNPRAASGSRRYGGKIKAKADTSGHAALESISYGYAIKVRCPSLLHAPSSMRAPRRAARRGTAAGIACGSVLVLPHPQRGGVLAALPCCAEPLARGRATATAAPPRDAVRTRSLLCRRSRRSGPSTTNSSSTASTVLTPSGSSTLASSASTSECARRHLTRTSRPGARRRAPCAAAPPSSPPPPPPPGEPIWLPPSHAPSCARWRLAVRVAVLDASYRARQ